MADRHWTPSEPSVRKPAPANESIASRQDIKTGMLKKIDKLCPYCGQVEKDGHSHSGNYEKGE